MNDRVATCIWLRHKHFRVEVPNGHTNSMELHGHATHRAIFNLSSLVQWPHELKIGQV